MRTSGIGSPWGEYLSGFSTRRRDAYMAREGMAARVPMRTGYLVRAGAVLPESAA